jgi:hypothetical protein
LTTIETYRARPIKTRRSRRTRADMEKLRTVLYEVIQANPPMSIRQVFYQMVALGYVDKTEGEYKDTVDRLLIEMRMEGTLPFEWIADNTRWMRKPNSYTSAGHALMLAASGYRQSWWYNQPEYVEIWLEKDALSGIFEEITGERDVPLMVTRGYPSLSFLYGAAKAIAEVEKPTTLYYFGDYDPSGTDIPRNSEARLRQLAPAADITFVRVAVNLDHIKQFNLPTRPTKETDSRSKGFGGKESVELDAMPPDLLRRLARECIERHVDPQAFAAMKVAEQSEMEIMQRIRKQLNGRHG